MLARLDAGEVRLDSHDRLLYSTDASLYQVEPVGVVIPSNVEQVQVLLEFCREHRIAVLPRGGGTSLAGQCTATAIVVDLSVHFRQLSQVDADRRLCRAQAGVVLDQVNRELLSSGLFFAPDPATSAQACIGGCIGNNAAGARSIRYGRTSENVSAIEVVLATGERVWLGSGAGRSDEVAARLVTEVCRIVQANAGLIRERFPRTIRRNAGYGLDLILDQLDAGVGPMDVNLSGLLCGSEGTLAITVAAELKLNPLPMARGLAIVSFDSIDAAIAGVTPILATGPTAVELLDSVVITAAAKNAECARYLELLPTVDGAVPQAVVYVEYQTEKPGDDLARCFARLKEAAGDAPVLIRSAPMEMQAMWMLRKAAEALLHGMSAASKPITFVEDNAVPVENLARFVREFRSIIESHGTSAAFYAHASVGVLHVRPMIDLHEPMGRAKMQAIAVAVADLARDCGGVMSGEHGDGKARGPLLDRFFGSEMIAVFRQIKQVFDPMGLLNPGNIVDAGPIESIVENLRLQKQTAGESIDTYFNYEDQEGFHSAVETCNGAGFCRKTVGGTMCPSYRATLDERHSTRGRGNALRLAITGQTSGNGAATWDDPQTIQTLELCLSCKACKTECPSNVDISRLKAEYTAQGFKRNGKPLTARVFGNIRRLNRIGAAMPAVANWMQSRAAVRWLMRLMLGISRRRTMPRFGPSLFRWFAKRPIVPREKKVVLFGDCFTTCNEPAVGRSAIDVLEQLGYQVILPDAGCCGRAMISVGLLDDAIATADRTLARLMPLLRDESVLALVVCEPSCLSAMKDEWLQLKLTTPIQQRRLLAERAMLVEDFVERFWDRHPVRPAIPNVAGQRVILHGHCHQKALWGDQTSAAILRRLLGADVEVLPSGCCGMAGAFGYGEDKFDLSMKIGELSVFPPIRGATALAIIAAPGTSCRHQIKDGTGRQALHPIQVVARMLEKK